MINRKHKSGVMIVAVLSAGMVVVFLQASPVKADIIGDLVTVDVSSTLGTARAQFHFPPQIPDPVASNGRVLWALENAIEMRNNNADLLGVIENLSIEFWGDPVVQLSFTATAGGVPTTFSISSAILSFPALSEPDAWATADVTLTDTATDGASFNLVAGDDGAYKAVYNGGTLFAHLIGPMILSSGGSANQDSSTGTQTIAGSVSSIQSSFRFVLSADDIASGHGRFEVVPEPAALSLLSLTLLAVIRRRR